MTTLTQTLPDAYWRCEVWVASGSRRCANGWRNGRKRSHAASVAPEIHMQTRAEAITALLADFGKPQGALTKQVTIRAFRHQDDFSGRCTAQRANLLNFGEIMR